MKINTKLFLQILQTILNARDSLILDFKLLFCQYPPTIFNKIELISKKYFIIIKHHFLRLQIVPERDSVSIGVKKIFYGSEFGIVIFQKLIVTIQEVIYPLLRSVKNPVVVDVGAHLGFFSIPLSALFAGSNIYAVEPVSMTFDILEDNIRGIDSIAAFNVGLSDRQGKTNIYYNPRLLMYSSLYFKRFAWDIYRRRESISITTLDSFCRNKKIPYINLLKIDVEGAEDNILKGGKNMLSRTQYLFMECSLDMANKSSFTSLLSNLISKNYNFQLIKIINILEDNKGRLLLVNLIFENLLFKRSS